MDSGAAARLVGILLVYTVFVVLASQLEPSWFLMQILKPMVGDILRGYAITVVGVAFACSLLWFAAGQWFLRVWAPASTWYLTWAVLLIVIAAAAIFYAFKGPGLVGSDPDTNILGCYLAMGILPFYISSVLFTSANRKYVIWPARHVVKW